MFDFITFGIKDFIDIAVVVFLVFQAYRLVRGTVAVNIFVGMIVLFLLWKLVEALQMTLLSGIPGTIHEHRRTGCGHTLPAGNTTFSDIDRHEQLFRQALLFQNKTPQGDT